MRRIIVILFLVSLNTVYAQIPMSPDSLLLDKFLLDFTVPDIPAFKALGTDPSTILRPSDAKKFAIMMAPFNSGRGITIPQSFALEAAPWKLSSKNVSLATYRKNSTYRLLYNTSLSLGTLRDSETSASRLAMGIRFKILGKNADFITQAKLLDTTYNTLAKVENIRAKMEDEWREKNNIKDDETYTKEKQEEFAKYFKSTLDPILQQSVSTSIEKFNKENWNAARMDVAISWLGASPDSLVKEMSFRSWQSWVTFATRPSPNNHHTQFLLGLTSSLNKKLTDTTRKFNLAANVRWYEGTKDFHGFMEFQVKTDSLMNKKANTLINLGAEIRVLQNFWIVFSGGVDNLISSEFKRRFISGLNLKYAFNK